MSKKNRTYANKNARIVTRVDRTGKLRTETTRRDEGEFDLAVTTDPKTGVTQAFFDLEGRNGNFGGLETLRLNGRQVRTLFIALQRHYDCAGIPSPSSF
jgi:hypothetical protein